MINQNIGYIVKFPSSSIMSSSVLSGDSLTLLVQQLKTNLFETDLFKTLKEDPFTVYEIGNLLKYFRGQN